MVKAKVSSSAPTPNGAKDRFGGGAPDERPRAIVVLREGRGARLDRFVAEALGVSRSESQRWIGRGRVTVNGAEREASTRLREGERIVVIPEPP
ncbi:MAG TPA: S4 domain-containing protein, partial [Polyangiaceae bacterium]|nr:S4 domain-containing protein [Polyangiaceae bacterium]